MDEDNYVVSENETELIEVGEDETGRSGNGLKTAGIIALTVAIGAGLFLGAKKLYRKYKDKKENTVAAESDETDSEKISESVKNQVGIKKK